jgi:LCP family protein required for cell wall assembly
VRKIFTLIIIALAALSWAVYAFIGSDSVDKLSRGDRLAGKKNIVVMGCDARPKDGDVGRSDTLFVVMLDPKSKDASLLSIPRDTRVHIKGHGYDKINHAYAYGGHKLTVDTVEEFLGIRVDNYVEVDFKGFKDLVDAIGGIDINVDKRMYYYDPWDKFEVNLKPGMQHLNGTTALQYVRYRDEEGDIGRIGRQQKFLRAVYNKVLSPSIIPKLPALIKQVNSMVKTDMSISELLDLAQAMKGLMNSKDRSLSMAMVPGTPQYINDISYWIPDINKLRTEMVKMQGVAMTEKYRTAAQTMDLEYQKAMQAEKTKKDTNQEKKKQDEKDGAQKDAKAKQDANAKNATKNAANDQSLGNKPATSAPSKVVVRLVNGTGKDALAAKAKSQLEAAGFVVIMDGSSSPVATTSVTATNVAPSVLNALSRVPFAHENRINKVEGAGCDGIVLLGQDYK